MLEEPLASFKLVVVLSRVFCANWKGQFEGLSVAVCTCVRNGLARVKEYAL